MSIVRPVAIALGGNLGDREATLRRAAIRIADELLANVSGSGIYETPPWGITGQPDFLNAVMVGETALMPPAILRYLKRLERELGRVPSERFGPRLIDLDLLACGNESGEQEGVIVPHPRLQEREFVLRPWAELWPHWRHPVLRLTVTELLEALERQEPGAARRISDLFPG